MAGFHRSLVFSFADRYVGLASSLLTTVLLARLLTPTEFGIYGVAMALVGLAAGLREFGIGTFLIQARELTEDRIRVAFTLTVIVTTLIATGLMLIGEPAARFYDEPGVAAVFMVAAAGSLALPVPIVITNVLRREMRFREVAICNIAMVLANGTVSVTLAIMGAGHMSPAWGILAGNVALLAATLIFRPMPALLRPTLKGWREVISFGGYSSATVLTNTAYNAAPNLLLGWQQSMASVGFFTRAMAISQLFDRLAMDAVQPLLLPVLASHARDGRDLKNSYLMGQTLLSVVKWPALLVLAALAEPIVRLLFGPKWLDIVPTVRILAIGALPMFASSLTYPILVAVGRIRDTLVTSLITIPPAIAIMLVAAPFGIEALALALVGGHLFQVVIAIIWIRRHIPFRLSELALALRSSAIVSACSAIAPVGVAILAGPGPVPLPAAFAAGAVALVCWYAAVVGTGHPVRSQIERVLSSLIGVLVRRRKRDNAKLAPPFGGS